VSGPRVYARNAAAMWASMAPWSRVRPGTPAGLSVIEVPGHRTTRVIVGEPGAADHGLVDALLSGREAGGRVVVEDCFGQLDFPARDDVAADRLPVMLRAAAPVPQFGPPGLSIEPVADQDALAEAEQVIVDGFPQRSMQPYQRGRMLPPSLVTAPGWRVWLARCDGAPAAACCTYDDGAAIGVYWVATMPAYRSRGLGRAIMIEALAAYPSRPATLVATAAGRALYSSLGFGTVAMALWLRSPRPR
jgi:GNAT superfamily N-acetyltransferase